MNKITYFFLLLTSLGFAQHLEQKEERIAALEMKAAAKKMNLKVNPNTQNYDLMSGKLEFTVNPSVYNISGKVTLTFKALANMNTVTFELSKPLVVSSVKKGATSLVFVHNANGDLVVTLPSVLATGNTEVLEINYSGSPATTNQAFTSDVHGSTPIIYTLSEPYGAKDWWPCKQDMNDKLDSIDVYITAPSQYVSVSNGVKQNEVTNGANKTTYFRHNYPIAAYLVAIAVTNYTVKNTGNAGGNNIPATPTFPIIDYIYPENDTQAEAINLARTIPIMNFFETKIGAYPFNNEKYGHAQFGWGGGMEHTTISFMQDFSRDLISHEMAHQWFGDKITCGSWKDIWLNEGLTEYMSGCTVEQFDGAASFLNWKASKISSITSATTGNLYLYDSQLTDVNRIFSSRLTYNKGSMVANMLRYMLGDANYFQALRNYLNDPVLAYKYALTPQFQAHLEAVYGSSLQEFFNDWVYKEGYPIYTITASNTGVNQARVQINQTQSITNVAQTGYVSYFEMPVPVRLNLSNGTSMDVKLNNTFSGQTFTVSLPTGTNVTGVVFDPNKDIISRGSTATLGSEDFELSTATNLYPNPSSDFITIEVPDTATLQSVKFINTLGQEVMHSNRATIAVSGLAEGLYQVIIETDNGKALKKFIKK
ncbi:M1 family aminopeptidase [Flavobacterium sp.]|uniref:M1 family aminopeptidase n=1 Tax=Flavobacterium sp. TaxID=239 RepID=UPI003D134F1F